MKPAYREALLQHYGIKTTWLDVVDNIWVALWFACHDSKSLSGAGHEYVHFERRVPDHDKWGIDYAYVLLVQSASRDAVNEVPGHYSNDRMETIDLRMTASSHFIRPHAQHGLLVRRLSNTGQSTNDCSAMHVGTIRVTLKDALNWLGSAATLSIHTLFPPAYYDYGYRDLLRHVRPKTRNLGQIYHVQP